jgi:hypothetical protein
MDAVLLSGLAGALLSLVCAYLPGVREWYAASGHKRLVMLGLLAACAAGAYALSCAGWAAEFGLELTCDRAGLAELARAFLAALVANQGVYSLAPQPAGEGAA